MANQEHLDKLKEGVDTWNQWREEHLDIRPDLSDANLSHANLLAANLFGANLIGANLSHANLFGANLSNANLLAANLSNANLRHTDLRDAHLHHTDLSQAHLSGALLNGADLSHADLSYTDLSHADLSYAELSYAELTQAICVDTIFANIDLQTVKGLASIQHSGPSFLTLHTIHLPQDGSALHFLRGAGTPDEWIDFYRATTMHPIQYHSCFISYSSKDDLLAHRLHADLQDHGVRCWFAPEDLKIGDKIRNRIDEAIHLQDKLLLLLSEHSLASSWVEGEVEAAFEKERRQQREVLCPIRLDTSIMQTSQAWAANLRRTRHIGDFTQWEKPDAYQAALTRLLRDLKAQSS